MSEFSMDRRRFVLSTLAGGTGLLTGEPLRHRWKTEPGRLESRPRKPTKSIAAGEQILSTESDGRHTILYVPPNYDASKPAPFVLALHGATGSGDSMLRPTRTPAEKHDAIVLAPSSVGGTWDAIRGNFADDLPRVDRMLADVFDRCNVDASRIAVAGMSDGASYALTLGLINGDLFTHIIAHSAGFIVPGTPHGKRPKVFLSHGRQDRILPIDQCGRVIAARLRREGFSLDYEEFDGGHMASPEMREKAFAWFVS
jgi:phospholipase/carboxylesterase